VTPLAASQSQATAAFHSGAPKPRMSGAAAISAATSGAARRGMPTASR